jgi:hypothetical protein
MLWFGSEDKASDTANRFREDPAGFIADGSDQHWAAFWQYKQFGYTLHRVMFEGVWEQAKPGNYSTMPTLGLGAIPVMIAADAVKEMLIPGDEPPWMKQGLGGMLEHGRQRAGIFGVPQLRRAGVVGAG